MFLLRYVLLLAISSALFAQGVTGSFTGSVKDSSGAVVPNALVKVRSVDSGREWQNTGHESGIYYIPALPPGQYTVNVEVPGFKRLVTNPIRLEVSQTARLDLTLEVGG